MKILMVCLGNICRSPLAEGILKDKLKKEGINWTVDSAGTSAYHKGELPDSRSIHIADKNHIDIRDQQSRQVTQADLDNFDLIYAMDSSNYQNLIAMCHTKAQEDKISMIMNMAQPGMNINVPDPYWGNDGFGLVFNMLDKACDSIVKAYRS